MPLPRFDSVYYTISNFVKKYPNPEELTTRTIFRQQLESLIETLDLIRKAELDAELKSLGLVTKSDLEIGLKTLELKMIKWFIGIAISATLVIIAGTTMAIKIIGA